MTEKRFKLIEGVKKGTHSHIWDNQKQHNQGIGDELWLGEVVGMLNEGVSLVEEKKQLKEENEQLKEINKSLVIKQFKLSSDDLQNNQRITELTNYALVQFIKSKGHTLEEINQFLKEL